MIILQNLSFKSTDCIIYFFDFIMIIIIIVNSGMWKVNNNMEMEKSAMHWYIGRLNCWNIVCCTREQCYLCASYRNHIFTRFLAFLFGEDCRLHIRPCFLAGMQSVTVTVIQRKSSHEKFQYYADRMHVIKKYACTSKSIKREIYRLHYTYE